MPDTQQLALFEFRTVDPGRSCRCRLDVTGRGRGTTRLACALALAVCLVPAWATAGQISGLIRIDERPVAARVKIDVQYRSVVYSGTTTEYGTYLVSIPHTGRCQLTIRLTGGKQDPTVTVVSYDDPTTYNIDVARVDGGYRVVRAGP